MSKKKKKNETRNKHDGQKPIFTPKGLLEQSHHKVQRMWKWDFFFILFFRFTRQISILTATEQTGFTFNCFFGFFWEAHKKLATALALQFGKILTVASAIARRKQPWTIFDVSNHFVNPLTRLETNPMWTIQIRKSKHNKSENQNTTLQTIN